MSDLDLYRLMAGYLVCAAFAFTLTGGNPDRPLWSALGRALAWPITFITSTVFWE